MWNDELARVAQSYAEKCAFPKHNPDKQRQQLTFLYVGETLALGYDSYEAAIQGLYNEVKDYTYSAEGFGSCAEGAVCGDYTQVYLAQS